MSAYIRFKEVRASKGTEWDVVLKPALQPATHPYLCHILENSYVIKQEPTDAAHAKIATIHSTPLYTLVMPNRQRDRNQKFQSIEAIDKFLDALCMTNIPRTKTN